MTKEQIIAGVIGGLITSIMIPFASYFLIRLLNKWLICVIVDSPRMESGYQVHSLRLRNRSLVTLKNVVAHISIDNSRNDIIPTKESGIETFATAKVSNSYLSWSKNIASSNSPQIEINQGEIPDLNLIRHHINKYHQGIEIASEQGFSDEKNKSRILLKPSKDYIIEIRITGDNFWPKKKRFLFSPHNYSLRKW